MGSLLDRVMTGKQSRPRKIVLYGTEGIGKSTLAAQFPNPIFLPTEDGVGDIDVAKMPLITSFVEVPQYVRELTEEEHGFSTLVIDSIDWTEKLIWRAICEKYGADGIESVGGGYGKGYIYSAEWFQRLLDRLQQLRDSRNMAIVLIAHAQAENFDDPEHGSYARFAPRLNKHANKCLVEWADEVLYAGWRMNVTTEDLGFGRETKRAKGVGTDRILRCVGGPACVAKNRLNMPPLLDMSWEALLPYLRGDQLNG